jgi:hypothetical protein
MDEATQIVDTAIARGTWLEADQTRMREVAVRLLPADRFALLAKLAVAGNADRLRDLTSRPMSF